MPRLFHTPADFGYRRDNPGGDWLARKQRWAVEDSKGQHSGLAHYMAAGAVTAWMGTDPDKPMYIDAAILRHIPGANDEQYYRKPGDVHFDDLQQSVRDNGWNQEYPVMIRVNHLGNAVIMEGNTRATIARLHGVKDVKVSFQWMNGGEDAENDLWSPRRIAELCVSEPRPFQPKPFWNNELNETSIRRWIDICEGDVVDLGHHRFEKATQNYMGVLQNIIDSGRAFYDEKFLPLTDSYIKSGFDPAFAPEFLIDVSFEGVEKMTPELRELGQSLRAEGFKNLAGYRWINGKRKRDLPHFRKKISFEEARRYFEGRMDGRLGAYQPSALGYGERAKPVYDDRGIGFAITMGGQDGRRGEYGRPHHEIHHVIDDEADMAEVAEAMARIKRARIKSVR